MSFERKLQKLAEKRTSDSGRLGALEFEERQYKSNQTRYEQIFEDYRGETLEKRQLSDHLDRQVKNEEKSLMEKRLSFEQAETQIQHELDRLKEQRIKIESTIKLKSAQIEKNLREIQEVKIEQKQIDQYAKQLSDLDRRIERKEIELEEKSRGGVKIDAVKSEISEDEKRRTDLQAELKELNQEIDRLLSHAKINTELEMFRKEKSERDEQIRKIKMRHNEILSMIFNGTIPSIDREIPEVERRSIEQRDENCSFATRSLCPNERPVEQAETHKARSNPFERREEKSNNRRFSPPDRAAAPDDRRAK